MIKGLIKHLFLLAIALFGLGFTFADNYIFFYGQGCPHCAKVEKFFEDNGIYNKFNIKKKEVYFDVAGRQDFSTYMTKLNVPADDQGVPFMVIEQDNGQTTYKVGDQPIIAMFAEKAGISNTSGESQAITENNTGKYVFLGIIGAVVVGFIGYVAFASKPKANLNSKK